MASDWSSCVAAEQRNVNRRTLAPPLQIGSIRNEGDREADMPLTRDFKETIRARAIRDKKFRKELLREGVECLLAGDTATGKTILRDYINATVGFAEVAEATHIPSKSLMRMLGPSGNPRADNLFEIVSFLQRWEGVRFHVRTELA
jgi:DNA-binding phage protein